MKICLFYKAKRVIIEKAALTEQNQNQVSLSLLLFHYIPYSKLFGNSLYLSFEPLITLSSISPITYITSISRMENYTRYKSLSSSERYTKCKYRSLGRIRIFVVFHRLRWVLLVSRIENWELKQDELIYRY